MEDVDAMFWKQPSVQLYTIVESQILSVSGERRSCLLEGQLITDNWSLSEIAAISTSRCTLKENCILDVFLEAANYVISGTNLIRFKGTTVFCEPIMKPSE